MEKLLKIGEFSRLCNVSVKALRFYEQQGLLRPEHVDSWTGYRFYVLRQAQTLALITNLRAANFPIAEIAALIGAGDGKTLSDAICAHRRRLETECDAALARIRLLDALSRTMGTSIDDGTAIRLSTIQSRLVHSVSATVKELGAPVTEMFEAAETEVARHQVRAPESPFLIFHEIAKRDAPWRVEVCIPLTNKPASGLPTVKTMPFPHACSHVYAGGYDATFPRADKMFAWIGQAGLKPAGPLREIYHRFGADQEDYRLQPAMLARSQVDCLTELQIPVSFA